jgi:calcineurin-like phosphoesterase family protein
MVKLYILSDLHLEHDISTFVPPAKTVAAADVVVLAGDIFEGNDGVKSIRWAAHAFKGKPVVLVSGNHEYINGDWIESLAEMRRVAKLCGVHFLENDSVILHSVRFLGCSLWTDYEYFGAERKKVAMEKALNYLPEFFSVMAGRDMLTPQMTVERHKESLDWLQKELAKPFDGSTVVVSHHFPHKNSCNQRYAGDLTTAGFGSRLDEALMCKANLWIHGHSHTSANYRVGDSKSYVRVICNPRGVPFAWFTNEWENQAFNPNMLVEQLVDGNWAE